MDQDHSIPVNMEGNPDERAGAALKAVCTLTGMGCKSSAFRHNGNETSQPLSSLLTMLKPKGRVCVA